MLLNDVPGLDYVIGGNTVPRQQCEIPKISAIDFSSRIQVATLGRVDWTLSAYFMQTSHLG